MSSPSLTYPLCPADSTDYRWSGPWRAKDIPGSLRGRSNTAHLSEHRDTIAEGCQAAKTLAHWAVTAGVGAPGAYAAAVLWAGYYSQAPCVLNSVGGFDHLLASVVRERARAMGIWSPTGTVTTDWVDPTYGELNFLLDVGCIIGRYVRVGSPGGRTHYDWASRSHRYRYLKPLPPVPHWWSVDRWPQPPVAPVAGGWILDHWDHGGGDDATNYRYR